MEILPQLVMNSIIAGAIYMMIALGFNLLYSTVKFFDLGYGALIVIGGYAAWMTVSRLGLGLVPAALVAALVAAVVSWLLYTLIYAPLRTRGASGLVMIVASLGVFTALQAVIAILFTSQFQTFRSSGLTTKTFEIAGGIMTNVQLTILLTGLIIMLGLTLLLKKTKFGASVRAVGDDEEVAQIVGINTRRVIGVVYAVAGAIAGVTGLLVGLDTGLEPTMGLPLLLKGVVAAIVGGIGQVFGGVVGAIGLGFIENFGIWWLSGEWKEAIAFGVLILFLIFRPQGIFRK